MRVYRSILFYLLIAFAVPTASTFATGDCNCEDSCKKVIPETEKGGEFCPEQIGHEELTELFRGLPGNEARRVRDKWVICHLRPFACPSTTGNKVGRQTQAEFDCVAAEVNKLIARINGGKQEGKLFLQRWRKDANFVDNEDPTVCGWIYAVCLRKDNGDIVEPKDEDNKALYVTVVCRILQEPCLVLDEDWIETLNIFSGFLGDLYRSIVLQQDDGSFNLGDCPRRITRCDDPVPEGEVVDVPDEDYEKFIQCIRDYSPCESSLFRAIRIALRRGFLTCEVIERDSCSVCIEFSFDTTVPGCENVGLNLDDCIPYRVKIMKKNCDNCDELRECVRTAVEEGCEEFDEAIAALQLAISSMKEKILECVDGSEFVV